MKSTFLLFVALLSPITGLTAPPVDDFDLFMRDNMKDFNSFITDANRAYIDFLRNPWKKYDGRDPAVKRSVPEPLKVPFFKPDSVIPDEKPKQLSIREIIDLTNIEGRQGKTVDMGESQPVITADEQETPLPTATQPQRQPSKPVTKIIRDTIKASPNKSKPTPKKTEENSTKPTEPSGTPVNTLKTSPLYSGGQGRTRISFAGIDYYVSNSLKNAITLSSVKENDIATAFESLYTSDYKSLIEDLTTLRQKDLRNDWALYLMIKDVAEQLVGKNESIVLRQFLLNNMGLRARTARVAQTGNLSLLIAASVNLYGCPYISEGNTRFYDVESKQAYSFYMCPKEAPDAKHKINMSQSLAPRVGGERKSSIRTSKKSAVSTKVNVPSQLMDFYNRIPQCDYSVYATAYVDKEVSSAILPVLKTAIEGKNEKEAANILLDFCQNGFEYATDPQQFGYEKPFFVEELFFYPFCDCEDRSILFRYLVKTLLGLKVVLLDYPNHIATAVKFNSDYNGDHVIIDGNKYLVCDPTYIGASIGMAMPQFKTTAANILKY